MINGRFLGAYLAPGVTVRYDLEKKVMLRSERFHFFLDLVGLTFGEPQVLGVFIALL